MNKIAYAVVAALVISAPSGVTLARGASKTEIDLREQLARSEAALAAATKERAEVTLEIGKLRADNTARAKSANTQRTDAAVKAEDNAINASGYASDAKLANNIAVIAAYSQKAQGENTLRVAEEAKYAAYSTMLTTVLGFISAGIGLWWKDRQDTQKHNWAMEQSKAAFAEANGVNAKIASIGLKLVNGEPLTTPTK